MDLIEQKCNSQPLQMKDVSQRQHRINRRLFEDKCSNLFAKSDDSAGLLLCRHNHTLSFHPTNHHRSRASTESTLVDDNSCELAINETKICGNGDSKAQCPPVWDGIGNVGTLRTALSGYYQQCALIIRKDHSWSRFLITRDTFETVCGELDVFDKFRDTIMYMGSRDVEHEVAPLPLQWRSLPHRADGGDAKGWECSYTLRFVQQNHRHEHRPWSLRQFSVYHQYNCDSQSSRLIFVAPPEDICNDYQETCQLPNASKLVKSIHYHLTFVDTSVAFFRPYIVYLVEEVNKHVQMIHFADPIDEPQINLAANGTRLALKILEDDIEDALLSLKSTQDLILALKQMWTCCGISIGSTDSEHSIVAVFERTTQTIEFYRSQLQSIRSKLESCTAIVSSFSELSNGHALRQLAEATRKESERSAILSIRSQRDAAAVKALSVIAIVYLPTTVVLNFFSTSLIDVSNSPPVLAPQWWLFLAIGVPLTTITLVVWYFWTLVTRSNLRTRKYRKWRGWTRSEQHDLETGASTKQT